MVASQLAAVFSNFQTLHSDHASVVSMNLFVALLCTSIVIGHLLEESRWMNESITALVIGLLTGVIILLASGGKSSRLLVFSEDLFFIYLLPPIIFNAGFSVKKKQFFRNFITIMLFGAVGTLISCTIISIAKWHRKGSDWFVDALLNIFEINLVVVIASFILQTGVIKFFKEMDIGSLDVGGFIAIGAIFAATDSVCTLQVLNQDETPLLYSLVFGEGVVNDATSVVLFNAIRSFDLTNTSPGIAFHFIGKFLYLFSASTLLGVVVGLVSAYIIKTLYFGRHSTDREFALMMLMAYLSYIMAELFYLSGILTVFFCGIVMSHYTWHNVTESSRVTSKYFLQECLCYPVIRCRDFIFLYVGMDALDIETWSFVNDRPGTSIMVSSVLLLLVMAGRAAFVFPLSFLTNLAKKSPSEKISFREQIIIWWSGLMRGAVSMALAYNQFTKGGHTQSRLDAIMITSTITVVLFSTVVFGLLTKPLIRFLIPHPKVTTSMRSGPSSPKSATTPFLKDSFDDSPKGGQRPSSIRALLTTPTHTVHCYWRKFDNAFMRPMFGGRGFVPFVPGSPTERSEHNLSQLH
ncbi:Sodium/hydrogen exchanger 2 [Hibiscus syriacus]|uniref:Sodium/hydrogen exchanger 2 n=1 Tax=Hibiscus syriacus TaxID=106335 RepID=A0A6A3C2G5_HIBSY|nr:Sodium/hydrogen exchanger 2 [Hibiscus syriacus]